MITSRGDPGDCAQNTSQDLKSPFVPFAFSRFKQPVQQVVRSISNTFTIGDYSEQIFVYRRSLFLDSVQGEGS